SLISSKVLSLTVNDNTFELIKDAPGTYTVKAEVVFDVNGETMTHTSVDCEKTVEVPEEPIFTCDALTLISEEEQKFVFEASHTAENGAEFIRYDFGVNGKTVQQSTTPEFTFEPVEAGTYDINVYAIGMVDGEQVAKTSAECQKTVEVEEEPQPIFECTAVKTVVDNEKRKVSVNVETKAENGAVVKHFVYDFDDGSEKLTTDSDSAMHTYAKDGTYDIDVTVVFNVADEVIRVHCGDQITIDNETPKELPNTGPAAAIASLFGTGALGLTFRNWNTSRKELRKKLLGSK
ncbi:MAG: PKD domain-containing protein, partial [Candidatus Saccharimonadales bacterium]|nr:PKD domain-containing protein [Candidatus Saccharimonadales bacterium]